MNCKKCGGLMMLQSFFDHFLNFEGWKCLNCGKNIEKRKKQLSTIRLVYFINNKSVKIVINTCII